MSTLGGGIYMNRELMNYTSCHETLHIQSRPIYDKGIALAGVA